VSFETSVDNILDSATKIQGAVFVTETIEILYFDESNPALGWKVKTNQTSEFTLDKLLISSLERRIL